MDVSEFLGLSKKKVEESMVSLIVTRNNVNCTIEIHNVTCDASKGKSCHALLYFDLADNSIMTMAVLKLESLSLFSKIRLSVLRDIRCREYIGSVTFTGKNEAVITYIRENIVKDL